MVSCAECHLGRLQLPAQASVIVQNKVVSGPFLQAVAHLPQPFVALVSRHSLYILRIAGPAM